MEAIEVYFNSLFTTLTLDEILDSYNLTHQEFRKACKQRGKKLPPLSVGLSVEVQADEETDRKALAFKYSLTLVEVDRCLYSKVPHLTAIERFANKMRQDGSTEEQIRQSTGTQLPLHPRATEEINCLLLKGVKPAEISERYGITLARVSQLNANKRTNKKRRVTLTAEQREELKRQYSKDEGVKRLADRFNIAVSTAHAILRT